MTSKRTEDSWADADFIEDYKFLVDAGLTRPEIARRLGIKLKTLEKRLLRLGIWYPEHRYRPILDWIDGKVGQREEFTASDLPRRFEPDHILAAILLAVNAGRIVNTGRSVLGSVSEKRVTVYGAP